MQIKPLEHAVVHHPRTGERLKVKSVSLTGYRCLAEVELPRGETGLADLPLGYHVYHPQFWNRNTNELLARSQFLFTDLRKEFKREIDAPEHWTIIKNRPVKDAFVLSCVDFVFGHCLQRVLNYTLDRTLRFPGLDCVLLIPKQLLALAPEDCAEIWVYSGPLSNLNYRNLWLERAFADLYNRSQSLYLSPASLHFPEHIDLTQHRLKRASSSAKYIIFSYRDSRCWGGNIYNQRRRLEKLGELLSAVWDPRHLLLVGIDKEASRWRWRHWQSRLMEKTTSESEGSFLQLYSESLLTIGCQGSNMLLPTMLSWSTIRFLTDDRLDHFLGGDFVGNSSATQIETLFKHRMLYGNDELRDLSAQRVARVAKSLIEYRDLLEARFSQPILTPEDYVKAAQPLPIEESHGRIVKGRRPWLERKLRRLGKLRNRAEIAIGRMQS